MEYDFPYLFRGKAFRLFTYEKISTKTFFMSFFNISRSLKLAIQEINVFTT